MNSIHDLLAVSRNDHAINIACGAGAFCNPANHRFPSDFDEGFTG
jgi:hypothetical protein